MQYESEQPIPSSGTQAQSLEEGRITSNKDESLQYESEQPIPSSCTQAQSLDLLGGGRLYEDHHDENDKDMCKDTPRKCTEQGNILDLNPGTFTTPSPKRSDCGIGLLSFSKSPTKSSTFKSPLLLGEGCRTNEDEKENERDITTDADLDNAKHKSVEYTMQACMPNPNATNPETPTIIPTPSPKRPKDAVGSFKFSKQNSPIVNKSKSYFLPDTPQNDKSKSFSISPGDNISNISNVSSKKSASGIDKDRSRVCTKLDDIPTEISFSKPKSPFKSRCEGTLLHEDTDTNEKYNTHSNTYMDINNNDRNTATHDKFCSQDDTRESKKQGDMPKSNAESPSRNPPQTSSPKRVDYGTRLLNFSSKQNSPDSNKSKPSLIRSNTINVCGSSRSIDTNEKIEVTKQVNKMLKKESTW